MKKILSCLLGLLLSGSLWAANSHSKVDGLWEARYDASDTPSAHIRIKTMSSGELVGVIEKAYPRPGETPSPYCTNCDDENKDKPIQGLKILWGMMPSGKNQWDGGHLLNVETGKTYSGSMQLVDNGNTLDLRGYIFNPIFGDTAV